MDLVKDYAGAIGGLGQSWGRGVHATAIVAPQARLGSEVTVGPYSIIGPSVEVGDCTIIGPHVVVEGHTKIGRGNRIFQFASIGAPPQDLKFRGEPSELIIGDSNVIRENVTLQPGTSHGTMRTVIGNSNLFMTCSHVAHDVSIGDFNIIANGAAIAGHVTIGDRVTVGGLVGVHQFVRIGDLSMLSGGAMVSQDIPPFCIAQGDRARLVGINQVGLERAGVLSQESQELQRTFRELFLRGGIMSLKIAEVRERLQLEGHSCDGLRSGFPMNSELKGRINLIEQLIKFIEMSERGVAAAGRKRDA